ncbi:MAG: nicotinate (nicotinamide) nucleotide adenylyltransferase, partial [Fimbriimonadales bacterium]
TSPFRTSEKHAEGHHRLEMLRLAIRDHPHFEVSDWEIQRGGVSYTIDTVNQFRAHEAQAEFYLIMGLDTLAGFAHWYQPQAILQHCQLLVGVRPTHDWHATLASLPEWVRPHVLAVPMTPLGISASDLRRRSAQGRSLRYLTPPDVIEYIRTHQLYTEPR